MAVDSFARSLSMAAVGNSYSKEEINKMFGEAGTVQVEAVTALPVSDIKENVIYLLAQTTGQGDNYHDEYMYVNNKWELIGTTEIDMSQYSTTEELQEMMVQELAKYITNADFIEALKDYATKKYVDDNIAAIEIPSIDGLATEEYVNNQKNEVVEQLATKQNVLTAGEGISIVNNVISTTMVFEGTQAAYDALSDEEKAKYTIVVIDEVLTQEDENALNNTIGEETETIIDLTTRETNSKLDDIIRGE